MEQRSEYGPQEPDVGLVAAGLHDHQSSCQSLLLEKLPDREAQLQWCVAEG